MKFRCLVLTTTLLFTVVLRGTAADIVQVHMNGYYFSAPATVEIIVTVQPDKANRTLRIEADGERMFRSTEITLEGDNEKRLHTVEFKNLMAGAYELRAEVLSARDVRGTAVQDFQVAGIP